MSAVSNTKVEMEATDGTIVTVKVPVGSMDEPTSRGKELFESVVSQENWKFNTKIFVAKDQEEADELAYTLDWYLGGHEMGYNSNGQLCVSSQGYYHYIGA